MISDLEESTYDPNDFSVVTETKLPVRFPPKAAAEESMYAALLTDNEDTASAYEIERKNLMQRGSGDLSTAARTQAQTALDITLRDAARQIAAEKATNVDTKVDIIQSLPEANKVRLDKELLEQYSPYIEQAISWTETSDEELSRIIRQNSEDLLKDKSFMSWVSDIGGGVVPFAFTSPVIDVAKRVLGEENVGVVDWINHAGTIGAIREKLAEMPEDELAEIIPEILQIINDDAGTFSSNDFIAMATAEDILSQFVAGDNPYDMSVVDGLNTVLNTLDAVAVTKAAKAGIYGMGRLAGSGMGNVRKIESDMTGKLLAKALEDESDEVVEALGLAKDDVIDHMMPKPDFLTEVIDDVDITGQLRANERLQQSIVELAGRDLGTLTASEKVRVAEGFEKALSEVDGVSYIQSASKVVAGEDHVIAKSIYGKGDGKGWATLEAANADAIRIFGDDADYKILQYSPSTSEQGVEAGVRGKFFIQNIESRPFISTNVPDILKIEGGLDTKGLAKWGSWAAAPTARVAKWISSTGLRTFDSAKAIEKKLYLMIDEPFVDAKPHVRGSAVKVLEEESERGARMTLEEIEAAYPREDFESIYRAKTSVNQMMDTIYLLNNQRLYNSMTSQGYATLTNSTTGYRAAAKTLERGMVEGETVSFFNASIDSLQTMTARELDELYASGRGLARIKGSEKIKGEYTDLVLLDDATNMSALTRHPLAYKEGYSTRYYEQGYVLTEKSALGTVKYNGKDIVDTGRVVHIADNKADADRIVARLNDKAGVDESGVTYDWAHDRQLTMQQRETADWQLNQASGRLFFGRRGERLGERKVQTKGVVDQDAAILGAVESLQKTASIVGRKAGMEDWINSLKSRFMNTYGYKEFPITLEKAIVEGKVTGKAAQDAKTLHGYIRAMEGLDDGGIADWWRQKMLAVGEWAVGNGERAWQVALGKKFIKAGEKDPLKRLRGLTFNVLIAANPLRQIVLQTQQASFLLGYNPRFLSNPLALGRQSVGLRLGAIERHTVAWPKYRAVGAKLFGTTEDDFTKLVDEWQSSGLPYSIDAHMMGRDALINIAKDWPEATLAKIGAAPARTAGWLLNKSKAIGFDFGEHNNLTFTWLAARDKYIRSNPGAKWHSRQALNEINADSRALSLSMVASDTYGYQKGWAATMFQFASVQQKAWALIVPEFMGGSKMVAAPVKARLAAAQVGLYGATGFGLNEAYEKAKAATGSTWDDTEMGKEIDAVLTRGLAERFINVAMSSATGDDIDIAFAKSQSALAGLYDNIGGLFVDMMQGNRSMAELVAGPSVTAIGRFANAISFANTMTGVDITAEQVPDLMAELGDEFLKTLSGYSNYTKSKLMLRGNTFVDKYGNPLAKDLYAAPLEGIAQAFGYKSNKEMEHWEGIMSISDQKKAVKEDAEHIVDTVMRIADLGRDRDDALGQREAKILMQSLGLIARMTDDEPYQAKLQQEVGTLLRARWNRQESNVKEGITSLILGNQGTREELAELMKRFGDQFDPETEAAVKALLDNMYKVEEEE